MKENLIDGILYAQEMIRGSITILLMTPDGILADNSDFTGIILSIAEAYMPGIVKQFSAKYGDSAHIKVHQYVRQALTKLFSRKPQALVVGCGGAGRAAAVKKHRGAADF